MSDKPLWGPWSPDIDQVERGRQLRSLCTLVWAYRIEGQMDPKGLCEQLRLAEFNSIALERARLNFDILPTLVQRKIMASFSMVNHALDPLNI